MKQSKFDPFKDEIQELLFTGMGVPKVAEKIEHYFEDIVSIDSLYSFIRKNNLRNLCTQGGTNLCYKAPKCNDCQFCTEILCENGESTQRICNKSRRIILNTCRTSPMWCFKRKGQIRNEGMSEMW